MNNYSITNRLKHIFYIAETLLNERKIIFPIDIFIAMILDNTGIFKDLNTFFNDKIQDLNTIASKLPKDIEGHKNSFFNVQISDSTLEVINSSIEIMNKKKQSYLNEIYILKSIISSSNELTIFLNKNELHYIKKLCNTSIDLIVDLKTFKYDIPSPNKDYVVRRALNEDKCRLYDFVKLNFNSIWADTLISLFPSKKLPIFLVFLNNNLIGFSSYDILGYSIFGPIGVLKEYRNNSIGKNLLNLCLYDMKLRGDLIATIKNAGPFEFYEKCCNAHII